MSIQEVRHQHGVKLTISELIAGLALVITVLSALNGWIVLPEQMRGIKENDARQDARIALIEKVAQDRAEIIARIDERTKRIEERLKQSPHNF